MGAREPRVGAEIRDGYFRNELIEATRIVDQGHAEAGKLTGSWDGGLGQCQFMPSNFHRYAVDKDGDGRADIPFQGQASSRQ